MRERDNCCWAIVAALVHPRKARLCPVLLCFLPSFLPPTHPPPHHSHQPLSIHCKTKTFSPNLLHSSISAASLFQVIPTTPTNSSLQLIFCLSCLLLPSLGCYFATLTVFLLYVRHMTCPTHAHQLLLIVVKMCSNFICSIIHDALFIYLHIMPSIIPSSPFLSF